MKFILAELSINSMPISIATAFLRVITAKTPKQNKIEETTKYG